MALRQKLRQIRTSQDLSCYLTGCRYYSGKMDWQKLRPMILKRIQSREKDYPVKGMIPVANDVIKARAFLYEGVSTLLKYVPMKACKFCPEVYIGEEGHLIETCYGYKRRSKNQVHKWVDGDLNDILVPVEAFHAHMFEDIIKHDQRFDFDRIPAVLELCSQAGANIFDVNLHSNNLRSEIGNGNENGDTTMPLLPDELKCLADRTLNSWERLRSGVERLLLVYPAKVCKYCSEVHVGLSGHKARLCGVFKYETWRGAHFWKKASVDDLVPPVIVWRRRNQDPPILLDNGRCFYGHAPAVVELCLKAGATVPSKYFCMMKVHGLGPPI